MCKILEIEIGIKIGVFDYQAEELQLGRRIVKGLAKEPQDRK